MSSQMDADTAAVMSLIRSSGYGPMLSTAEVAEFTGLSTGAVHKALVARRLKGFRLGGPRGRWRVAAESLAQFVCGRRI